MQGTQLHHILLQGCIFICIQKPLISLKRSGRVSDKRWYATWAWKEELEII